MTMKWPDEGPAVGDLKSQARGSGARFNAGKAPMHLVPLHALEGTARVLDYGRRVKYTEWNWAKGMPWDVSFDCALRHLLKWFYEGQEVDPESGQHPLDHAICNLLFLRTYIDTYPEGDNRPLEHFRRGQR